MPLVTYKNIKSEVAGSKVTLTFEVENAPADLAKFEIAYSKSNTGPLANAEPLAGTSAPKTTITGVATASGGDQAAQFMAALDQVTTTAASGSKAPIVTGGATRSVTPPVVVNVAPADITKVMTYETTRIKNGSGAYVWYINNLDIALYNFTISGVRAD